MEEKFIIAEEKYLLNEVTVFWCQYDVSHYTPLLFDRLGIRFPSAIGNAVNKRQAEFLCGRYMAARALSDCGIAHYDIGTGPHRSPVWPAGIAGSISHTGNFAVSAAQPQASCRYLGLDIESPLAPQLAENIRRLVVNSRESVLIARLALPVDLLLTLFFSAKESLFKAIYPSVKQYLDFKSSEVIDVNISDNRLLLRASDEIAEKMNNQRVFSCCFRISASQVLTMVSDATKAGFTGSLSGQQCR